MHEVSTYEGVEVFENRNLRAMELDVDCFAKETKSVERRSVWIDATNKHHMWWLSLRHALGNNKDFDGIVRASS